MASVHAKKACRWNRGIAPLILNLVTRRRWVVNFTPRPLCPGERILVPITNRKLIRPQIPSGWLWRKYFSCSCRNSNPGPSSLYPVEVLPALFRLPQLTRRMITYWKTWHWLWLYRRNWPPNCCHHFPALQINLRGHKFKDNREVETFTTRWLITKDTDWFQQEIEKLLPR
jgi:hypothetical protein